MVEYFADFVNFEDYAYGIEGSAGLIADEWQKFFVVVLMLHSEFGFVAGFLLVEVVDILFEICSLDDCGCVVMSVELVEIVTHFVDNVGPDYCSDTLSRCRTTFDSVAAFAGVFGTRSTWMNGCYFGWV